MIRVVAAVLERAGLAPSLVQEVIMGNVISAGLGQVGKSAGVAVYYTSCATGSHVHFDRFCCLSKD